MFGFLRPANPNGEYRRLYARLCQHQQRLFGHATLPFLSYEATFAYALATNAGLCPKPTCAEPTCCRLHTRKVSRELPDRDVGAFCAAFGMMLARVKVEDGVRDREGWLFPVLSWWWRGRFDKADRLLAAVDPKLGSDLAECVAAHHRLESNASPIALKDYVEPTATGFGRVFDALAGFPAAAEHRESFRHVGQRIGAALLAFDCAADWSSDRWHRRYNPLPDADSRADALSQSRRWLRDGAARCRGAFGNRSIAGGILTQVADRLEALEPRLLADPADRSRRLLERWGLLREPGYAYAKCDGVCEGIGAGLACVGESGCCEGLCVGCTIADSCGSCGGNKSTKTVGAKPAASPEGPVPEEIVEAHVAAEEKK